MGAGGWLSGWGEAYRRSWGVGRAPQEGAWARGVIERSQSRSWNPNNLAGAGQGG